MCVSQFFLPEQIRISVVILHYTTPLPALIDHFVSRSEWAHTGFLKRKTDYAVEYGEGLPNGEYELYPCL